MIKSRGVCELCIGNWLKTVVCISISKEKKNCKNNYDNITKDHNIYFFYLSTSIGFYFNWKSYFQ